MHPKLVELLRYFADAPVPFQASVAGGEGETVRVSWRSDVDGRLDLPSQEDATGVIFGQTLLSTGSHQIEMTAIGDSGLSSTEVMSLDVLPANAAPSCDLVLVDGPSSPAGTDYTIAVAAEDDRGSEGTCRRPRPGGGCGCGAGGGCGAGAGGDAAGSCIARCCGADGASLRPAPWRGLQSSAASARRES